MQPPSSFPLPLLSTILIILTASAAADAAGALPSFREAPAFRNGPGCSPGRSSRGRCGSGPDCDRGRGVSATIHVAMTLDHTYLRGSLAGVHSVLHHASCPENIRFHFLSTHPRRVRPALLSAFPSLPFSIHRFDPSPVRPLISLSLRPALDQPLNYARIYLADLLPHSVPRVIYLDSDIILVDDIVNLWSIPSSSVLAAPEYCHANFTAYFTDAFWSHPTYPLTYLNRTRPPCYFNTGVMVIDLHKWRSGGYTKKLESWMEVQKKEARIYELGSLPPFLLVFAGEIERVEHRWNQHGLGGDNVKGLCRDLHPGPVSLLHWSGKGKPWLRLDAGRPCPLDGLWKPYDLLRRGGDREREMLVDG